MNKWLMQLSYGVLSAARYCVLGAFAVVLLYPVLYSLSVALRPAHELYDPLVMLVPRTVTFDNIKNAVSFLDYFVSLGNSLMLVTVSTLLQMISCSLTGYGLARFRFKGRGLLFALVILVIVVPPQTVIIPNYIQLRFFNPLGLIGALGTVTGGARSLNLINNPAAFYLPAAFGMGIRSGLCIFIFRQFFRGMPRDLEEAAFIDGCGPLRAFAFIMAPNARGAFLSAFLFSAVWYWNDYVYTTSYLSLSKTVMNKLYQLKDNLDNIVQYTLRINPAEGILLMQAGVLLAILPLLFLYITLQKYFTESIERAGIVG